ncbi:MAG: hypothetical protein Q4F84_10325 [Fibrobacter sp.]|nr:hypothetical protein [Fibrobacter sp.]
MTNRFPIFELPENVLKRLSHLQVDFSFDIFPIDFFDKNEKPLKLNSWSIDNNSYNACYNAWVIED